MDFILGSQSPRRKEILGFFNLPFKSVSPQFDEDAIPFCGHPKRFVQTLSKGKAESLIPNYPSALILTADTIVFKEGKIYGKPKDETEALFFLKELSGQWHSVFTGITLYCKKKEFHAVEETRVLFNRLNQKQMQTYLHVASYADKAGGYMIQGAGSLIVKRIEGCYYNVVGLPINALSRVLHKAGIDLWKHLKGKT